MTIHNAALLDEYLLKRKNSWIMFGGSSISKPYIIKPKDRLMMIQRKEGWKFVFVREQHKILWMDKGSELMAKRLGNGSTRIPVRAQPVLRNESLTPPVPQGEPATAPQPPSTLPTAQVLDETFESGPATISQIQGEAELFTASEASDAEDEAVKNVETRQKEQAATQTAQQEQEAAQKAQQEQEAARNYKLNLPIPHLFNKSHLAKIEKCNEEDRKFWISIYGAALSCQKTQAKILQTLNTEEMERQKDIRAFKTAPKQLLNGPTKSARELRLRFKEQVAKLEEVNNAISSTNLATDRDEFFGQVHTYGLVEPKLNDQYDFKSIVTQTPELQRLLAKPYRKASELQHYHLNYMKATEGGARDSSIETRILEELTNINNDIDDLVRTAFRERLAAERKNEEQELKRSQDGKVSKKQKKDLDQKYKSAVNKIKVSCLVYVPNEGEDDYTLGEENDDDSRMSIVNDKPHIEQPGDGEGGQSEKQPLPKEIYEIRSRMGGRDGPLFHHIDAKLRGERDNEAEEKLKSLASEVDKFCETKDISRATYALDDTQVNAFYGMVVEVNASLVLLKANLDDPNAQSQYNLLRSRAELFIQQHQWPEAFLDTFVPTEDEIVSMVADKLREEQEAALKAQQEQEAVLKAQQEQEAAQKAHQEQEAREAQQGQEAREAQQEQEAREAQQEQKAQKAQREEARLEQEAQKAQLEKETVRNTKVHERQPSARKPTNLERAEKPALLENYKTQGNYTTKGNAGDPERDQAQTEVERQPAGTTIKPQLRQLDPAAKDKATVQFEEQHASFRSEYVPMAHKRSFGEMQNGHARGSKTQRRKQELIELMQGNYDGYTEESVVRKKLMSEEYQRRLEREKEEQKERKEQKEIKEQKEREEQKEKDKWREEQEEILRRAFHPEDF
ncbi:hypothetical protein V501_00287 [Pseudogymnoascus sp. VKM F-4519 (FW-2642)]|nr:hypothetical protein V501_00287 [Pseudogymnoascus sp. VKM F-4519 (FW-2642)]